MGFLKDISKLFTKHALEFVERNPEISDIQTFTFKPVDPLDWIPGQHGIFFVEGRKLKGGSSRAFSIASTPGEGTVKITMRIPEKPSEFKQFLSALKPGEQLVLRGPVGAFYSEAPQRTEIFIAGGIGITPYRSLLRHYAANPAMAPKAVHLIYGQNSGQFVFREEIDRLSEQSEFIKVSYVTSNEDLNGAVESAAAKLQNSAYYYVSGPAPMVKAVKKLLRDKGIKGRQIKADPFIGY